MKYLLARVENFSRFQGEALNVPAVMGYAKEGNPPHEMYNFKTASDGSVYAYLPKEGGRDLKRLGADPKAKSVDGITVVFISDGKVCGYFLDATIFREPHRHPDKLKAGSSQVHYVAKAKPKNVFLVEPAERHTAVMSPRPKGMFPVLYGNETIDWVIWFENWRESEADAGSVISEYKRIKKSTKIERLSKARKLAIEKYGYNCEACGDTSENPIVRAKFEVHHKVAYSTNFWERKTSVEDLAVLCANCHRQIHKMPDYSDVASLAKFLKKI